MAPFNFPASEFLQVATSQHDVRETAVNHTKYGKALGADGEAWCSTFIWWCLLQCGVDVRKTLGLPGSEIASVAAFMNAGKRHGWYHPSRDGLRAGDLLIFDRTPANEPRDHIRAVIWAGSSSHKGVGGNESDHVHVGVRDYSNVIGYLRPPYAAEKRPHGDKRKIHTVTEGESLSTIARDVYDNGDKWPTIYAANRHTIGSNPSHIVPGMHLIIP